jgi:hypothetical protein
MKALKRLDDQARQLERTANGPSFEAVFAGERGASPALGGRTVFGVGDRGRKDRANAGELIERLSLRGGKADEAIQEANCSLCSVMTPGLLRFARNDGIIKRGSHARQ